MDVSTPTVGAPDGDVRGAEAAHLAQVYSQFSFEVVTGDGAYLICADGRRLLDLYGGHAVCALGYGHPRLIDALQRQASELHFASNAVALRVRARAADKLAEFAPPGLDRVFFVNSGAEANENALRLACRLTGRSRVVALEHGFHGRSAAAAAVTWGARERWYGFPRTPFDVAFVPRDDVAAAVSQVNGKTAAVIVEPIQGLAGAFTLSDEYLQAVRAACDRHGAFLIADEVQCGMGRSGLPFAISHCGVAPDLITTAKSLGAGFSVRGPADAGGVRRTARGRRPGHHLRRRPAGLRGYRGGLGRNGRRAASGAGRRTGAANPGQLRSRSGPVHSGPRVVAGPGMRQWRARGPR